MKKASNKKKLSADEIAELADKGNDISVFFTNKGKIKVPIQKVNIAFTISMIKEIDSIANELNISRQALIKTYLRQALDQHYTAYALRH
ncbi:MAG: hypothetical protein HQK79_04045 [Desulfobacterales bacterium]|nr:hypothetical protein [Desulfobacterales bacterium]